MAPQRSAASKTLEAEVGQSLMELARGNGVPGIVAECNGSLFCATCHCCLLENASFEVPEPSEMEEDMLDFAASEQRETSRLSCQVIVTEEMDGAVIALPRPRSGNLARSGRQALLVQLTCLLSS